MLNHRYDYQTNLEASLRINWQIEDVIGGRKFDYAKPFLPESLAGVDGIRCLSAKEKLKLNQIRGYTYLYLFGLVEEYILPSVVEHAETTVHGDDYEIRALLRFAEEEAKHIQLFKRGYIKLPGVGTCLRMTAPTQKGRNLAPTTLRTLPLLWGCPPADRDESLLYLCLQFRVPGRCGLLL